MAAGCKLRSADVSAVKMCAVTCWRSRHSVVAAGAGRDVCDRMAYHKLTIE